MRTESSLVAPARAPLLNGQLKEGPREQYFTFCHRRHGTVWERERRRVRLGAQATQGLRGVRYPASARSCLLCHRSSECVSVIEAFPSLF